MLNIIILMALALPQTDADRKILEMADRIETQVAEIREQPVKRSVEKGIYNKVQLKEFILENFAEELPDERLAGLQAALTIFGLIPEEMELKQTLVDFYVSQIGGFYDPKVKKLYCMTTNITVMQRIVMAHEIAHSLQDQYMDLESYYMSVKLNDDLMTARLSVIEGEATHVMNVYPKRYPLEIVDDLEDLNAMDVGIFAMQQFAALKSAPPYFMDSMTFSYTSGERFIRHAMKEGGWKRVDELYLDPPESTEQIIHPEKFFGEKDEPQKITLPAQEGLELIYENTMGEFQVEILLKYTADPIRAMRAAPGWDGDTYHVYRHGDSGAEFMVWALTFDTEKDARQFVDAERKALRKKYESWGGNESDEGSHLLFEAGNNRSALVERRDTDVVVLDWVPGDLDILESLRKTAWTFEKGRFDFEAVKPVPYPEEGK